MPARPAALLFDWDNTLVNTWPVIHAALNVTLDHMGAAPWSLEKVMNTVAHSMRDSFPELFGERWEEAAAIYQQSYRAINLQQLIPLPGAEAVLQAAQQAGLFIGAVSNKKGPTLREEIAHLGWNHYFQAIIGAGDAEQDKPHPAPARMALTNAELPIDADIWFIGDTAVDLECANRAGCIPVLYGDVPITETRRFGGQVFYYHVKDHAALRNLLI